MSPFAGAAIRLLLFTGCRLRRHRPMSMARLLCAHGLVAAGARRSGSHLWLVLDDPAPFAPLALSRRGKEIDYEAGMNCLCRSAA